MTKTETGRIGICPICKEYIEEYKGEEEDYPEWAFIYFRTQLEKTEEFIEHLRIVHCLPLRVAIIAATVADKREKGKLDQVTILSDGRIMMNDKEVKPRIQTDI